MSYDWPRYQTYRERLSPDAPPVEVELPQSWEDAFDLVATISRLAETDFAAWQAAVRQYTASDWFVLYLVMSGAQRMDPFTGRPEVACDFQFQFSREHQFDGDRVLDKSFRGSFKSTWRCYVGVTNVVLNDPNAVVALAAHEKMYAQRHGVRNMLEWENNVELKAAWPDVFYADPRAESPLWTQENGITLRRTLPAILPTLSWHSILGAPTGGRVSVFVLDDVEAEGTVESPEMREKTLKRVQSFLETAGRVPRVWINGTAHHAQGVVAHLEKAGAFRTRCHKLEDDTKPPPDIAKLYDECGGVLPLRDGARHEVLSPAIRDIRLDGEPVYLHPLEVAQKRLDAAAVPGGLDNYYRQNMGSAFAGLQQRLDKDWIRYYQEDPVDRARGGYGYILIDPSKGINDPMFLRLEVTKADKTINWCGAVRRKVQPSDFCRVVHAFAMEWDGVCRLVQIRIEEFGQATWISQLREYMNRIDSPLGCALISCSRHSENNKESTGRRREWMGLEPLYRNGRRWYPKTGILVQREREADPWYDVVDYYVEKEYADFPMPLMDDGLAADYLLACPKGKSESGKMIDLSLEYPETDADMEQRERSLWHEPREDEASWMSSWAM